MSKKKKTKLKKILKWSVGVLFVFIITLVAVPFLFKDKIVAFVTKNINENINATFSYKDTDLSLLKNFPLASLSLKDIAIINKEPFLGDTLYAAKELNLNVKLTELFNKEDEPLTIKSINTKNAKLNILFNENGNGNYDIAKKSKPSENETESSFSLTITEYSVENLKFIYFDAESKNKVILDSIYHSGAGNFAKDIFDLDTKTKANFSLFVGETNFLNKVKIDLNALIALDLKNSLYTFKKNQGHLNQLPLEFDGSLKLEDDKQMYNLTFKTPTSSFKNGLALFPEAMTGSLQKVKTVGDFTVNGIVKGELSDVKIPEFTIRISANNAMFKYADLPKAVQNINLNTQIINTSGLIKDTYILADKLSFKIDDDIFTANGKLMNLGENTKINLTANGRINLENIGKVYPVKVEKKLAGILTANLTTNFSMTDVKTKNFKNIKNAGTLNIRNFKYDDASVAQPFYIDKTTISFNTNNIKLQEFEAKTGASDLSINGNLDNFYGFIFNNSSLKGNFNLTSTNLKVADFISKTEVKNENEKVGTLKIPDFLDITLNAKANSVLYDNINLKNVSGTAFIKNQTITLKNVSSSLFGGNIKFDGNIATLEKTPSFAMDLKLDELAITESFSSLEMLKTIAPIAKTIEGKINSTINVSGKLTPDYTPDLKTITGKLFGQLLNTKLKASNSKTLSLLDDKVSFLDTKKLNLDKLTGYFSFENGIVNVKPIPIKYDDINMTIAGSHGFDKSVNYTINFDVPTKYLGTEITAAIAKLTPKDASEIKSIPVKALVTGSFTNPSISTDIKQATSNLLTQIVEKQKQNLADKGKNKLKNLLGLNNKNDSIKKTEDIVKDKAKDVLKNLFGKRKKDSTKKN